MLKAPTLSTKINEQHLLWFKSSNRYIIVDNTINKLINLFVNHNEKTRFIDAATEHLRISNAASEDFYNEIDSLFSSTTIEEENTIEPLSFDTALRVFSNTYSINEISIQVNYSHPKVKELLHPQIAYLDSEKSDLTTPTVFDVFYKDNSLYFYKNTVLIGSYQTKNYPVLQGRFCMELLCVLNDKTEEDWLGTLHASTVSSGKEAILVIGKSGKGKSTFTAHAMASGLNLVADDFSPILAKNKHVYSYPGAISIKSGAFKSLSNIIPGFDSLPLTFKGQHKGDVRFVAPFRSKKTESQQSYPCQKMISIHYKPYAKTVLKNIPFSKAMEIFVPDSWISPKEMHAKEFMMWIEQLSFYELTYSNTQEAIEVFSKLFNA